MKLRLFQVDAFASQVFAGNPAAVVPLESWLDDATLQGIATENNLSETAFLVRDGGGYEIRWMTPMAEVDLCGHATLASAWVVFHELDPGRTEVVFQSKSGPLSVATRGEHLVLDFPSRPAEPAPKLVEPLGEALDSLPSAALASRDLMAVYEREQDVRSLSPDMHKLSAFDCTGVIATAPGDSCDFVSRFFAPAFGIPEDPVTGSAHCTLVPYWVERLGKTSLLARQISARGGELSCELRGDRVGIAGHAVKYLDGTIEVPDRSLAPAGERKQP
jgi:PhzF family phenazine biosynthesis protein